MFNFLNDILFEKKGDKLSNVDGEQDYSPYMINRWLSMYTPEICNVINSTVNWLYPVFEQKTDHYNFLLKLLPQCNRRYIPYIKRVKEPRDNNTSTGEDDYIKLLSRNLELSEREVKYLIEQNKTL